LFVIKDLEIPIDERAYVPILLPLKLALVEQKVLPLAALFLHY